VAHKTVDFITTDTFDKNIEGAIDYLSQWRSEIVIIEEIEALFTFLETKLTKDPYLYPRCAELMELGVLNVRAITKDHYKIIYAVIDKEQSITINLLLFLRQNQSVEKQLIEHCIYFR